MKSSHHICVWFFILFLSMLYTEAEAVRPPLKPLNREQLQTMIADADVIATGTVMNVRLSKTMQPPLETVVIHVDMAPDRIVKGGGLAKRIVIEESYQQYAQKNEDAPDGRQADEKTVTAHIAGPGPQVGRYRDGDRMLVFLKRMGELNQYRPLGSGNYDAYLGAFQITGEGVTPGKYRFDEILAGYARSEAGFLNFIISIKGEHR